MLSKSLIQFSVDGQAVFPPSCDCCSFRGAGGRAARAPPSSEALLGAFWRLGLLVCATEHVLHSSFLIVLYFWLRWVFVGAHGLSLIWQIGHIHTPVTEEYN